MGAREAKIKLARVGPIREDVVGAPLLFLARILLFSQPSRASSLAASVSHPVPSGTLAGITLFCPTFLSSPNPLNPNAFPLQSLCRRVQVIYERSYKC